MAVDVHPSRRPSEPRKPPAVPPTVGVSGQDGVHYGSNHKLSVTAGHGTTMSHHFTSSEGKAPKPGKEHPQEGPHKGEHAGRPGDERSDDEPG